MTRINDNGIERDMTPQEQAIYDAWASDAQKEQDDIVQQLQDQLTAKASALSKLKALGLTDAEIAALVG